MFILRCKEHFRVSEETAEDLEIHMSRTLIFKVDSPIQGHWMGHVMWNNRDRTEITPVAVIEIIGVLENRREVIHHETFEQEPTL